MHLTVLRDEQRRHRSSIENISWSEKHCSTKAQAVEEDATVIKFA